jgi:EmrB/QacA subfamily drug resistance transporter
VAGIRCVDLDARRFPRRHKIGGQIRLMGVDTYRTEGRTMNEIVISSAGHLTGRTSQTDPPPMSIETTPGGTAVDGQRASKAACAILAAMGFGAFIAQMFSTVIAPALPTIKADLGLGLSAQTWTITAYSLAFGAALVAGGRLGDLVGEVKMIVIGFIIFGVGLVISAIAVAGPFMISGRAIQGIGIGISAPATLSIVVNSFPIAQRGFAVAVWGVAHGYGMVMGPLFCAWVMHIASWRWVFWVAVLLTALVILVTLSVTRGYKSVIARGTYDWPGLIIGGSGITLFTYGLQNSSVSWTVAPTWGSLTAGVVLLAVFGFVETRSASPLVDFGLWKERLFCGGFFAEVAVGFAFIPFLTFVGSLYFIDVLGYSPAKASWVIVVISGICMLFEPTAGRWIDKVGPGIPITVGLVMQAVALAWIGLFFGPHTTLTDVVIPLALMCIGAVIAVPACNAAGMAAVDAERAGMGSGLIQMTYNIPAALGVALVTSIIGTITATKISAGLGSNTELDELATNYAHAIQAGNLSQANDILTALSNDSAEAIKRAAVSASSAAITTSMLALAVVALAGAIFAWVVIGRRRTPDHIEMTHAAQL